jgi:poly-gamma-glutamate system protein
VSRSALVLITVLALGSLTAVEVFRIEKRQPYFEEKIMAARLAQQAIQTIRTERLNRNIPIDWQADPTGSGLIGSLMTPVTSNRGVLSAKQTSVNPNFAAVIVDMLKEAGVAEGDAVAVGYSGSFPAFNICVEAALYTLKLNPVMISSASASQWGANIPEFLWIDMEQILKEADVFPYRSVTASIGGIEDTGLGMTMEGHRYLKEAITGRNHLPMLKPRDYADSVEKRMAIYREHAGDRPIKVYISVGGGTSSVGTKVGKRLFRPGLNFQEPSVLEHVDSVMLRFVQQGVPVIHLIHVENLAEKYGLAIQPAQMPAIGEGDIFLRREYSRVLAGIALVAIVASLFAFVRMDLGQRIIPKSMFRGNHDDYPEPMI